MNDPREATDDLPRALTDRLAGEQSVAMLTPRVDAAVLAAARAQFAGRRRRRNWARPAAIAATLVVTLTAAVLLGPRPGMVGEGSVAERSVTDGAFADDVNGAAAAATRGAAEALAPGSTVGDDIDGSGQVDILDAFALARADGGTPDGAARVAALAARIVSLDATERAL
jgi:hypothetical protein